MISNHIRLQKIFNSLIRGLSRDNQDQTLFSDYYLKIKLVYRIKFNKFKINNLLTAPIMVGIQFTNAKQKD